MKVEVQQEDAGKVSLQVEVSQEEMAAAFLQAAGNVARRVNVPGFRKGKAPRAILERFVGKDALRQEALEVLLPKSYAAAVDEAKVEPVDDPEVTLGEEEPWDDRPFSYQATVIVRPTAKLGDYADIHLDLTPEEVTSEQVDQALEGLQRRMGQLVPAEVADKDSVLLVELEYRIGDGESVKVQPDWMHLGREQFLPGVQEALVGAKADELRELETTLAEGFGKPEDVGKTMHLRILVKEVKREELPPMDDELAKTLNFETLQELRVDLENNLKQQAEGAARKRGEKELLQALREKAEVLIPEAMIRREMDYLRRTVDERYFPEEELRRLAEEQVHNELAMEAVALQEGIEATPAEVEDRLNRLARSLKRESADFKASLKPEQLQSMSRAIVAEKVLERLLDRAGVGA